MNTKWMVIDSHSSRESSYSLCYDDHRPGNWAISCDGLICASGSWLEVIPTYHRLENPAADEYSIPNSWLPFRLGQPIIGRFVTVIPVFEQIDTGEYAEFPDGDFRKIFHEQYSIIRIVNPVVFPEDSEYTSRANWNQSVHCETTVFENAVDLVKEVEFFTGKKF